ncbi:MAG: cell division protease FtsH [Phycisphaerales bacterium]|nr:cell division protease FtsH [Phycisphaerales bacterium]MEA2735916.1 cell division protease FtsH [Humisphaera sp.]
MSEQRPDRQGGNRKNGSGGGSNGGRPANGNSGLRFGRGLFGWVLFVALAVMLFMLLNKSSTQYASIPLSEFYSRLKDDKVKTLTIESDKILGEFRTEEVIPVNEKSERVVKFQTALPAGANNTWELTRDVLDNRKNAEVKIENSPNWLLQVIIPLIPWLLIFAFIWFFVFRQLRNSAGAGGMLGNFGRSRHKITSKEHTNVTFEDVAGVEEAKDEVMEIVEFLKNPKKFQRLGGRIPRGVLLVGEPGTGKTLLAKAIAGEADVPFFSISGSDFVEMFVGVGASRVRDLFKQAKDNSPCIIFLDEIDAVGRRRGSGFSSGGHDEREQTLNAILVEMDGFDTNDQVIVCAATNRVDVLDPALTRPGRFDRQIYVPLPDVKGRMDILKVHSRKVKLGPNVDLLRLGRATPGFSGADLAAIINEAALGATLANKEYIEQDDLEEARDKVRWGRARKSRVIDEKEKLATAYHEAGHAVVQHLEKDADPVHKVTIIPRGNFGGATFALPEKDRTNYSRKWCIAQMKVAFAGRIAEEMFTGDVNTGVMGDIRQATSIARRMIREWGMNDRVGFVYYGDDDSRPNFMGGFGEGKEYSEQTAKIIDEEIKKLIDTLFEETRKILEANRERVDALAKALLKYETLDSQDVDRIMRGDNLTRPTVGDLLEREQSRGGRGAVIAPNENPAEPDVRLGGGPLPAPG